MGTKEKIKKDPILTAKTKQTNLQILILLNDDVNSFDFVIECLVEVCGHDYFQAEQCAMIAHYKGKCEIKKDEFTTLRSMRKLLTHKGLNTIIV